ncbi:hypothetical protein B296_00012782 [Ensete ventricosum]|uniref:Uncharacterized protein n=1 Tax=Ensete ventricosum TaxID=4639 RepID=A0A427AGJ1_ENSVE|nr:hypothetical protein B296_00012782 [Ensete ventricosum]
MCAEELWRRLIKHSEVLFPEKNCMYRERDCERDEIYSLWRKEICVIDGHSKEGAVNKLILSKDKTGWDMNDAYRISISNNDLWFYGTKLGSFKYSITSKTFT